jgi:hypothetical protein
VPAEIEVIPSLSGDRVVILAYLGSSEAERFTGVAGYHGSMATQDGYDSKVQRVSDRYDLDGVGEDLAARWTGQGGEQYSLRELEAYYNRLVLRAAMREAGLDPLDGEVDNLYDLLTGDDVSEGQRVEAENRLERDGVDVEAVYSDFVSHQSIHTYLKNCQQVSYESDVDDADRVENAENTIFALQSRTETVTTTTLEQLANADAIELPDFDVFVDLRVSCSECGRYTDVRELLDRGGCECQL